MTRIAGLDGLRGLAALAVFGVHVNQTVRFDVRIGPFDVGMLLENGDHGVALFFILSGFLLAIPFWRAMLGGADAPSLRIYTVRRLARILPAYYVALTLLVILTGLWRFPAARADIALHYLFIFNFTEFSIFSINPPFWTLAVEMQFYVLLPLLFVVLRRLSPPAAVSTVLVLGVVAYGLHHWVMSSVTRAVQWPFEPWLTWVQPYGAVLSHSLLAHLPHFLVGVAVGALFVDRGELRPGSVHGFTRFATPVFWVSLLGVVALLASGAHDDATLPYGRYGLPWLPLLLAASMLSATRAPSARRVLESAPLRILGTLSYGFYIFHLPCMTVIDRLMLGAGMDASVRWGMFTTASLALSLLVAGVSFVLIERPALRAAHAVT